MIFQLPPEMNLSPVAAYKCFFPAFEDCYSISFYGGAISKSYFKEMSFGFHIILRAVCLSL